MKAFESFEEFNSQWHNIGPWSKADYTEKDMAALLSKFPDFVERVAASTFDFFGASPEMCRKASSHLPQSPSVCRDARPARASRGG